MHLDNIEKILMLILLVLSFLILFGKSTLTSIIALTVYSLISTLIYLLLDAPDVAITEASIGACITSLFLLHGYAKTYSEIKIKEKNSIIALCLILSLILIILYVFLDLPTYGSIRSAIHHYLAPYYLEHTGSDIGINSVVSAILASYRAYDTMGETIVIFTAAISVYLLMKMEKS